jgi:hypothetical protein
MGARQKRIQLRSDKTGSEFALCISDAQGTILASTNPKASYVRMVEEVEYIEGQKYEWEFMLERWVESVKNGWHQPQPPLPPSMPRGEPILTKEARALADAVAAITSSNDRGDAGDGKKGRKKRKGKRPDLTLKCHFCGLWFESEARRADRENAWHPSRLAAGREGGGRGGENKNGHSL